jgi:type IV pilus assembly protein PilP
MKLRLRRPMKLRWKIAPIVGAALLGACGGAEPPPPPKPAVPVVAPAAPPAPGAAAVRPLDPAAGPALPPLAYDPKGRRDPFSPVSLALEAKGINVTAAKLVGIVQGRQGPLALVEGPDGVGYILKNGDALGNGRVTAITGTTVTFSVSAQPGQGPTTVTLRLVLD